MESVGHTHKRCTLSRLHVGVQSCMMPQSHNIGRREGCVCQHLAGRIPHWKCKDGTPLSFSMNALDCTEWCDIIYPRFQLACFLQCLRCRLKHCIYLYERHLNWRPIGRCAIDGDASGDMLEDVVADHCEDLTCARSYIYKELRNQQTSNT